MHMHQGQSGVCALTRIRNTSFLFLATISLVFTLAPAVSAGKPGPSTPSCSLPATDTCTDYVSKGRRWANLPIPYYVNLSRAPAGTDQDVQDAFLTWENEVKSPSVEAHYPGDRSSLDFVYMGTTNSEGGRDGKNVVYFTPSGGSASVTPYAKGGQLLEFDMVLNANWAWSTDLTCPTHNCGTIDI